MKALLSVAAVVAVSFAGSVQLKPAAAAENRARFEIAESGIEAPEVVGRLAPMRQDYEADYNGRYVFTRLRYDETYGGFGGGRRRGGGGTCDGGPPCWGHDFPDAEYNFAKILSNLSFVRAQLNPRNIVSLDDDRLFQFPILYMVEPGPWMDVRDGQVAKLREYLLRGGFMMVDDFNTQPGMYSLAEFMRRVLPELVFMQLDGSEALFDSFFTIDPQTLRFRGGPAYRGDRIDFWGLFEDNDKSKRLLVVAGDNGDLGDFWEYSDRGWYAVDIYNESYKVGINYIVYALTH